jgi:Na+/melibiose symporter-like transporter
MFQIVFRLNAFQSGLYLLAIFAGDLSMKAFVIRVLRRFGFRRILIVNGVITAASMALCATLGPATPIILVLAILFFHGACAALNGFSAQLCSSAWGWESPSARSLGA